MFDFNYGTKSLIHLSLEDIWFSDVNKTKAPINVE